MKQLFSKRDSAAILLAALLVWGPMIATVTGGFRGDQPSSEFLQQNRKEQPDAEWPTVVQAISAALMVALVGGQVWIGNRQNRIAENQTIIQRAQHALTVRPKVIFRFAELTSHEWNDERKPNVLYRLTNIGGSPAHVTKFFASAHSYRSSSGPINLDNFLRQIPVTSLGAGQSFESEIDFAMPRSHFDRAWTQIQAALQEGQSPKTKFVFTAMICYRDDTGLERQTSTWRTLDLHTLRFMPSDDSSCEYVD